MRPELPGFTTRRLQRGYSTDDVDAYLSQVFDVIARGGPVPERRGASFGVKLGGYDMQEVDAFLKDLGTADAGSAEPTPESVGGSDRLSPQSAPVDALPAPSLKTVRVGAAYKREDVNAFFSSLFAAVSEGREVPRIEEARFRRTWRGGYAEQEVDDYLAALASQLGQ